jgi:ADP-ribose pyrophosphatase YjhB (NUDIX family)
MTVEFKPEYFEHVKQRAETGCVGDASVWVTDDAERALLIRDRDSPNAWDIPGGGHEPGETMEETGRREVREETGVECTITGVNYLRRNTITSASDPDERYYMLTAVFDATFDSGSISVGEEVLEAEWFLELPENLLKFVEDHISRE